MLTIVEGIKIDANVTIKCPEVGFKTRRASKCCEKCEHFKGIAQMNEQPFTEWQKRFVIRCGHPIERRVEMTYDIFEE